MTAFDHGGNGVAEKEKDKGVRDGDAHQKGDYETEGKLAELAEPGLEGAIGGEQGAVYGKDDEGPDGGDGVDETGIGSQRGDRVGAGDEGEKAGH